MGQRRPRDAMRALSIAGRSAHERPEGPGDSGEQVDPLRAKEVGGGRTYGDTRSARAARAAAGVEGLRRRYGSPEVCVRTGGGSQGEAW